MVDGHFQAIYVHINFDFIVLRRLMEAPLLVFGRGGHGDHTRPPGAAYG